MGKFIGEIGFGETVLKHGVAEQVITERPYMGEVMWDNRNYDPHSSVNTDLKLNNAFTVVADSYANGHFMHIKYIRWAGREWTVSSVEVQPPRLRIYIGGVYNGPIANRTTDST